MLDANRSRRQSGPVRPLRIGAVPLVALAVLTGCGSDYPLGEEQRRAAEEGGSELSGILTGVGSSAQNAAMLTWRSGFESLHPDARVQYLSAGSGAGRSALVGGGTDFAGSDVAMDAEEQEQVQEYCGPEGALNIPVYISPISVAFNLPGIQSLNLDAPTIARIFRGEITRWNDPAIAALNPDVDLPDLPITPVSRSDDSGTTENFTDYLHQVAPDAWPLEADGSWPAELPTERAQGNAGVVSVTADTVGAITYADDSLVDDSLGRARVKVGDEYVAVSGEAAGNAVAEATRVEGAGPQDLALDLDRTPEGENAYPIVLVSYHIYCTTYEDQQTVDLAQAFGHYVVSEEGQELSAEAVKSAPLPENVAADAHAAIDSISVR